jgi:hypothetical protein
MAHWNMRSVESSKNKVIDAIDEKFEYEQELKKVRKDAKKMSRGQLAQKYPKILIENALKEVSING